MGKLAACVAVMVLTVICLSSTFAATRPRHKPPPPANVAHVAPEVAEPATDVTATITANQRDAATADVATAHSTYDVPSVADADSPTPGYVLRL